PTLGKALRHAGARAGRSFAEERADPNANIFDHAVKHIADTRAGGKRVLIAGYSEGSLDRLTQILAEHGREKLTRIASLAEVEKLRKGEAGLSVLPLDSGFETPELAVLGEQDILGDRLIRRAKKPKKASDFIAEVSAL